MERNNSSSDPTEEDYIDMDISSTTFFCYSINSPPQTREFEFQMSSNPIERDSTTSPADELFYKGKLLPLHLPPRLQMVEKLLQNNSNTTHDTKTESSVENFSTTTSTPFESCNISPSDSCQVSRELNPYDYFYECAIDDASFIDYPKNKSWSKKLKLIRHSTLGLKLKASTAYLKSLFTKSGCSDESCTVAARNGDQFVVSKAKECSNKYMKVAKKNPFGQIQRERYVMRSIGKGKENEESGCHRRSFSGAVKRHSATKSSTSLSMSSSSCSSFSSGNSKGFYGLQMLKRSNSVNSEGESSIQEAIAHCKKSQQLFCTRKSVSEVGFCSLSASRIAACDDQERPGMCRG
ncbi:putative membrane-associated kinase regulator 4 [Tasmannia lanceolata]|uniref:putative membrane-associated kinase regulator 4 n=1 Tax=Tasmannia lanceolata TaxID=3420 RepID=UPI004064A1CD